MMVLRKILRRLNGKHYGKEYVCLPLEQHTNGLHMMLVSKNMVIKDITANCLMVGICPLIFALPSLEEIDLNTQDHINIFYLRNSLKTGSAVSSKSIVAKFCLKKLKTQTIEQTIIYFFEGLKASHKLLSPFHQFINRLNNTLYNKMSGNIFLKGNLHTQIEVVYTIPQVISLIAVRNGNLYNIFPTDQHGQINSKLYIITLRHAGNGCKQVQQAKKILLSNINAAAWKEVFGLGKNHMQPLKEPSNFNLSNTQSQVLQIPLPLNSIEYRELNLMDSFIHGIHRVLIFEILSHQKLTEYRLTLSCINNTYATWSHKNKLPTNYFMY
jgi:hypothetical protein